MVLRFGRRSQEVDAWPNIDSFLRRFNDPETAETFNESAAPAAAASAPHAIDSFGDAFTFFCARRKLPRQLLLLLLLRPAISIRFQHFTAAVVAFFFVAHFAESTIWLSFRVNTFYVPAKPAAAAAAR